MVVRGQDVSERDVPARRTLPDDVIGRHPSPVYVIYPHQVILGRNNRIFGILSSRCPCTCELRPQAQTRNGRPFFAFSRSISISPPRTTQNSLAMSASFLSVSGSTIVDEDGRQVILRGAGLGGWMTCVFSSFSALHRSLRSPIVQLTI